MSSNNDDIELKDLKIKSTKTSDDSIKLASEETITEDEGITQNRPTLNADTEEDEEESKEEQPFLNRNDNEIEMRVLNNNQVKDQDENPIESTSLIQNNDLDAIREEGEFSNEDLNETIVRKNKWQRIVEYLSNENSFIDGFKPTKIKLITLLIFLSIVFIFVFIPNCIESLDYHHIALARNKWTGTVHYKKVYYPGLHFLLPWKEFITFDSTVKHLSLDNLRIFTTDKLEVKASFRVYYFIERDKLGELYKKFGEDFTPVVNKVITSELMNAGQVFSIEDFRTRRNQIKTYLKERLGFRLRKDYLMSLFDLYFSDLNFTDEINKLNLKRILNGIYNEKASYDRLINSTIAETNLQIETIKNQARIVLSTAEAQAYNETLKKEKIDREYKIELAHTNLLNNSLYQLGFYQTDKQSVNRQFISKRILSFCYLTSLINNEKLVLYPRNGDTVNF